MKLPSLKIGKFKVPIPIIQGGMSVRVSTPRLAAAVSNAGGIGIIGASAISVDQVIEYIRKTKEYTKGIVAVNIMFAVTEFEELVMASIDAMVDLIFTGAGFSRDIYKMVEGKHTEVVSIVSSPGLAKIAERLGAAAIVLESKEAGGHLGTDRPLAELLPEVRKVVKNVPLIAAGGMVDGRDIAHFMNMGADGVQLATRFVLSDECEAPDSFKQCYLNAKKEDIRIIHSPTGFPGRAINNPFVKKLMDDNDQTLFDHCRKQCLKRCDHRYCIVDRLNKSVDGDVENGLVFSGENVYKLHDILPVKTIMHNLVAEAEKEYKVKV